MYKMLTFQMNLKKFSVLIVQGCKCGSVNLKSWYQHNDYQLKYDFMSIQTAVVINGLV